MECGRWFRCVFHIMQLRGKGWTDLTTPANGRSRALPDGRRGMVMAHRDGFLVINAPDERVLRQVQDALEKWVP